MTATAVHAQLGWLRLRRGRAFWWSLATLLLPVAAAFALAASGSGGRDLFDNLLEAYVAFLLPLCALLAASGAVADEIETHGVSFLLVRPPPRSTLLVGKWLAIVLALGAPLALGVVLVFIASSLRGSPDAMALVRGIVAAELALSAFAAGAASLGVFAPRHPVLLALAWLLVVEAGLGGAPVALSLLSVSWHVRNLADLGHPQVAAVPPIASAAVVAAFAAVFLVAGAARLSRSEFA